MMNDKTVQVLKNIFSRAVQSVQVSSLIKNHVNYNKSTEILQIFEYKHCLKNKNVYLVGAGKAVFQLGKEVEYILGEKLNYGIASIPFGAFCGTVDPNQGIIKFYEGAKNNLPDINSQMTTTKIINFMKNIGENDVLLVLLSGGGSALLPAPIPPITLDEKCQLINALAKCGANIIELNIVRKRLSIIKGGKLLSLAYPAEVITLLLSDILEHHYEFIASGPTYKDLDDLSEALNIVKKYKLESSLPVSIKTILNDNNAQAPQSDANVTNHILGNNVICIDSAKNAATELGYFPLILSHCIHGDVKILSSQYCRLIEVILLNLKNKITVDNAKDEIKILDCIPVEDNFFSNLTEAIKINDLKGICIIAGGEPVVKVSGSGNGGRSQELALRFSSDLYLKMKSNDVFNGYDIFLLCAGTDGIDGPTDAAGAIGYSCLIEHAMNQNLNVHEYLKNNDTYSFFQKFSGGSYHIKIGHTNTNVMDLHLITIQIKSEK